MGSEKLSGFFEIGIDHPMHAENVGSLWRSAYQLGAAGIFVIGKKIKPPESDTAKAWRNIPYRQFLSFDEFFEQLPYSTRLVAIEMSGTPLSQFSHPERAVYLLGSEHNGLSAATLERCHAVVSVESTRSASYNVAVAGSLVMYHRWLQQTDNG